MNSMKELFISGILQTAMESEFEDKLEWNARIVGAEKWLYMGKIEAE